MAAPRAAAHPPLTGESPQVSGDGLTLLSSAEETAKDVRRILHDRDPAARGDATPRHRPDATGDPLLPVRLGRRFPSQGIDAVERTPVGGTTANGRPT